MTKSIGDSSFKGSRDELYEHVDWKLALIVSQIRKMKKTYVLVDDKILQNFYSHARDALQRKPKHPKYMQTLIASEKYLEVLQNIERLENYTRMLFADPESHKDIFPEQKRAFKENMQNTVIALKDLAASFFKVKCFMASKNMKLLDYLNKNILAIVNHAKDPEDFLKLLILQDTAKLLMKLPVSRSSRLLKSCLKTAVSIGVTIGIVVGAIVLGFGSEAANSLEDKDPKKRKTKVKKRRLGGTKIMSHHGGVEQVNLFKKSK
jgi:uncharacterized membrane-anchored protein YhcB (DUF1043 family)